MAGAPRAALRFTFRSFISITRRIARGVTAMVVGSGALLGANPEASTNEVEDRTGRSAIPDSELFRGCSVRAETFPRPIIERPLGPPATTRASSL